MKNQFDNKIIAISGGSGSWGNELIKQLLETDVKEIRSLARGEYRQVLLQRKFNDPRLKIIIGDVRDYGKVDSTCRKADIVFHLSALKHIPVAEEFPYECIKTNINGTRNIIRASIANKVKVVIDVSSDKACLPINLYGMTKSVGEKLISNASKLESDTKFMVIRGGNVLGSNGSVIELWIDQIKRFHRITLTDKKMTRYFLTLPEAIKLLFTAVASNINGGLFVMRMPSCKIIDMAKVVIDNYARENVIEIEEIGIRQGEKLDELLISKHEALNTFIYDNNYYLIMNKPTDHVLLNYRRADFEEYSSKDKLMDEKKIEELLKKGGYLK